VPPSPYRRKCLSYHVLAHLCLILPSLCGRPLFLDLAGTFPFVIYFFALCLESPSLVYFCSTFSRLVSPCLTLVVFLLLICVSTYLSLSVLFLVPCLKHPYFIFTSFVPSWPTVVTFCSCVRPYEARTLSFCVVLKTSRGALSLRCFNLFEVFFPHEAQKTSRGT
jgi:hypothetical protein